MEVIDNKFYVNAKDINYIDIKKKISETDSPQIQSTPTNTTRFKLLSIYQNITKNLKEIPVIQTPTLTASSNVESVPSVKRKRSEETSEFIDVDFINNNDNYKSETNEASSIKANQEESENLVKKNKSQKKSTRAQIKERPIRTTRSPKMSHHTTVEDDKSDKE
ncbi:hypothetical protein C2G38_2059850 [Gigaspora rosea]|uniref:Uncharacterized protein n=1 Tax=Gigaspora rosea TaxID=44941 RepID=A0A397W0G3_9GLOM|nr:hypothetical protein C2G38_2059850 [Gigaspora rosea]